MPSNNGLYHINIDTSVKNTDDIKKIISAILCGYISWLNNGFLTVIKKETELNNVDIARQVPGNHSRQNISLLLKKQSNKLTIVGSGNKQATPDKRGTACLSPLPIDSTPSVDSVGVGHTIDGVGSSTGEATEVVGLSHKENAVGSTPTPRTEKISNGKE